MNLPLVSVIIPAYNHENYVQDCINSIIAQTHDNIELIILDDGSKDNTWHQIQELKGCCEKRFARVHFETKENEGTCKTLNKLIALAKGEFIYLIASDDQAKPQAIEKELLFLKNNLDYVLVVGDNELIDDSSKRIGWDIDQKSVELSEAYYRSFGQALQAGNSNIDFSSSEFGLYETLVVNNYIPNGYLIRKSALDQIENFTPEPLLEDWWLHLQLSKIGKYKYLNEILFSYRWHDTNTAKRAEYMCKISHKTRLHERSVVESLKEKKWQQIFDRKTKKIKMKLNIFDVIKIYTVYSIDCKQKILELFGHKFILKNRPINW